MVVSVLGCAANEVLQVHVRSVGGGVRKDDFAQLTYSVSLVSYSFAIFVSFNQKAKRLPNKLPVSHRSILNFDLIRLHCLAV